MFLSASLFSFVLQHVRICYLAVTKSFLDVDHRNTGAPDHKHRERRQVKTSCTANYLVQERRLEISWEVLERIRC